MLKLILYKKDNMYNDEYIKCGECDDTFIVWTFLKTHMEVLHIQQYSSSFWNVPAEWVGCGHTGGSGLLT